MSMPTTWCPSTTARRRTGCDAKTRDGLTDIGIRVHGDDSAAHDAVDASVERHSSGQASYDEIAISHDAHWSLVPRR